MDDLTADDADDPAKQDCIYCLINRCDLCLFESRPTSCGHTCTWLLPEGET